jgi:sodium-dependent dicarboxylate transporter 2/3/5
LLCVLLAWVTTLLLGQDSELTPAGRRSLFILLLAIFLWVSDAIPAFSVGILVIAMQVALLGDPKSGVFAVTDRDWEQFAGVMGNPLIWLFFGGFVLAAGMEKCGLDRRLAARLLARFGTRPTAVLLSVMSITFTLSMFISNTATTAMMLAMLSPVLASIGKEDRFGTGMILATAVAANLGGMASLIGTPPNAIAVGALASLDPGQDINFLQWLLLGLPPALISTLFGWQLICRMYPSQAETIHLPEREELLQFDEEHPRWQLWVVASTVVATIVMWLTSQLHGVPTAAVSFLPIVVLTTTGILGVQQIRGLNYDILFLLAGGLALGQMVAATGLSDWIVAQLPLQGFSQLALVATMMYVTMILSNFMSNTAAANVLVPIGIAVSTGFEATTAVGIAFGASAAMCLPVTTPPNAMAYATGRCRSRDFLFVGSAMSFIVPAIGGFWLWLAKGWVLGPT